MRLLTIAFIALTFCTGPAAADAPMTLFRWQDDRCALWDIPDAPARAWRDTAGHVRLLAAAEVARTSIGPDLARLRRECAIHFEGRGNPDPARQDDRIWITSVFARGGGVVDALGHAEFHGHAHPGACDAPDYMSCWRNALVALQSSDDGDRFQRIAEAPIARLPYRYDPAQTRRSGYFNPSNIFERGGFLHAYFFAEAYGAQRRGVCLMRRPLEGGADSWRFWDGVGFEGRFADPYTTLIEHPERHVCTVLPGLSATLTSVVLQPEAGRYLAVSPKVGMAADGARRMGIWALQSLDLIHWTEVGLLVELPLLWARDCDAQYAHAYPAFIDPDSPDPNFATVGSDFWLVFVRMKLDGACRTGPERDLIAVEVNWPAWAGSVPAVR